MRRTAVTKSRRIAATVAILALIFAAFQTASVFAAGGRGAGEMASDQRGAGRLMLHGKGVADELPAMQLGTDIQVKVSGPVARVTVTQAFRNTSDGWMEATYLYPLPDDGAVDSLKMVVGQRIFEGKIKPREEARQIYEQAKADGRKSGLVEQARANRFRNSVANVGPGETVLIAIEFQAPVQQLAGEYALRLPLVVGPRYVPPRSLVNERGEIDLVQVADAANVTAPLAHPKLGSKLNPVSITVELDPGFEPAKIDSPYHPIKIVDQGAQKRLIILADGEVPANRDFKLSWRAPSGKPAVGLFKQEHAGLDYLMATITPPAGKQSGPALPREMIFVIDNSGSMAGDSMIAAKTSLIYALGTLRPQDTFNVIRFDDTMTQLFSTPVRADERQVAAATRFAKGLDANGGTDMLPALRAALVDRHGESRNSIRQIIFLTDGNLSDEAEMMAEIATNRGRSRVFMVGMGSAPNTFLMRRMSETGRGTFTHVGTDTEAVREMKALLDRLTAPVATDIKVTVSGASIDLAPRELPDLYRGEPLVLLGRTKQLTGTLKVTATIGGKTWTHSADLSAAAASESAAKLWAYRRIAEIEAQRYSYELDRETADAAIEELGLEFHLVTSRTSLVAEDETPSRPEGATLTKEELPLLLPAGWDFDTLFKGQNAAAKANPELAEQSELLELPETATGFMSALMAGLLLMLTGLFAAAVRRRRMIAA
ncbi:marine proteobacterial sortase target protein [Pontixanthobacter luteolus]|uniref:marine proteobacterial sortase target protein n=1 Tax=Pontixanthobacter luteolus TaxID=295089 RepID=UPI002302B1F2|nr:marine proteobacterial sortase target protein [Pontixanthobacter luteolus]